MNAIPASSALSLFAALSTVLPASPGPARDLAPGGLRRLGVWGFSLRPLAEGAAEVRGLEAGGPARAAGLRDSDRVVRIAGRVPADEVAIARARRAVRAGERLDLEIERRGRRLSIHFELPPLPFEQVPGCEVTYGAAATPSGRVRLITTRPAGARGARRTLVFIPWLSPDAVETPAGSPDGWIRLLHGLSRRGWQVIRIEKPGIGDSEGEPCEVNDLDTDLAAFRAALASIRRQPDVDPARLVLFGGSIGAALAPILALEQPTAALIASGGFSHTWREHMLEFERARLALSGESAEAIERAMPGYADFYALYLDQRLTPAAALARRPDLKPLWYDSPGGQFGRPAAYYQQLEALKMGDVWSRIETPTLILYGEYDWIMSRAEHVHIDEILGRRSPGLATLEILPRTGHNLEQFASPEDAFRGRDPRFDPALVERVAGWLDRRVR